jgi:glycosyltransferase involved in cell wall biosynthesis
MGKGAFVQVPRDEIRIAVVIPAYKVSNKILSVIAAIPERVSKIIVVDDCCPEDSGEIVKKNVKDGRVQVLTHLENRGVGGAVKTAYQQCLLENIDIVVKIDGDGQMDPVLINLFTEPIISRQADYVKGNRFTSPESLKKMPKIRIFGNLALSFITKISTGYWDIFDPNNGYTAISTHQLRRLNLEKINDRYFFESDMLFRLGLNSVRVLDVPIEANYNDEKSSLSVGKSFFEFSFRHLICTLKRISYTYFLGDFSLASLQLLVGTGLSLFGVIFGFINWIHGLSTGIPTQTGPLIWVAMTTLSGLQLLLSFFASDIARNKSFIVFRNKDFNDE